MNSCIHFLSHLLIRLFCIQLVCFILGSPVRTRTWIEWLTATCSAIELQENSVKSFENVLLTIYYVKCRSFFSTLVVGITGFEPATSCSRNMRATKLRHIPKTTTIFYVLCCGSCCEEWWATEPVSTTWPEVGRQDSCTWVFLWSARCSRWTTLRLSAHHRCRYGTWTRLPEQLCHSSVLTLYKLLGNVCFHRVPHLQPVSLCDSGWVMGSCCRWSCDDVLTVSSTLSFQNKILYSPWGAPENWFLNLVITTMPQISCKPLHIAWEPLAWLSHGLASFPDTGFSYLRALLIGAIPGVSFPHLCQYGVRLLSLPPPCDRGGPLIQFGSVMTAGSLTFGIRILNF